MPPTEEEPPAYQATNELELLNDELQRLQAEVNKLENEENLLRSQSDEDASLIENILEMKKKILGLTKTVSASKARIRHRKLVAVGLKRLQQKVEKGEMANDFATAILSILRTEPGLNSYCSGIALDKLVEEIRALTGVKPNLTLSSPGYYFLTFPEQQFREYQDFSFEFGFLWEPTEDTKASFKMSFSKDLAQPFKSFHPEALMNWVSDRISGLEDANSKLAVEIAQLQKEESDSILLNEYLDKANQLEIKYNELKTQIEELKRNILRTYRCIQGLANMEAVQPFKYFKDRSKTQQGDGVDLIKHVLDEFRKGKPCKVEGFMPPEKDADGNGSDINGCASRFREILVGQIAGLIGVTPRLVISNPHLNQSYLYFS